jgi:putative addiction module component (TIGR02574 family)
MSATTQALLEQALALPAEEQQVFVEDLLAKLYPHEYGLDPELEREIERRIDDYDNGRVKAIPAEEALAMMRQR